MRKTVDNVYKWCYNRIVIKQNYFKENKMATVKIYTLDDIAKELFVTKRTIYNYIKDKKIRCTKIGKLWTVSESELNYIKENGLRN